MELNRFAASSGSGPVSMASSSSSPSDLVVVVGGLFALQRHHLRILRLCDLIRRIRIDEADDDVDQAHLAGLDGFVVPQQQIVGARDSCRARS